MVRSNAEIYAEAKKEAANIMTQEQIAMNAMFTLRREMERHYNPEPEDEDDEDGEVITVSVSDVNFFKK
jgi:putative salt-induced outer membrane protein YdiY